MLLRRESRLPSTSTAPSMSRCGSRPRGSPASRATRRSTARPPNDATEVLVWYSPTAIHFGIRAFARRRRGARHARRSRPHRQRRPRPDLPQHRSTTAARRSCSASTRSACRLDGALVEGARQQRRRLRRRSARARGRRPQPRLRVPVEGPASPTTATRSRSASRSRACATSRATRRTGASTSSAASSAAGARGQLGAGAPRRARRSSRRPDRSTACTDLRRGLVLDLNPVVTAQVDGARDAAAIGWGYDGVAPGVRRQRALGRHDQPDAERHGQSGLLAGRVRRRASSCSIRARRCSSPRSGRSSSTASSSSRRRTT